MRARRRWLARKLRDGDAGDFRVFGMRHRQLLARGGLDHLGDAHDIAGFIGRETKAERSGIGDDVEHPAIGDIHSDRAQALHLDGRIEVRGEGGDVAEGDLLTLPLRTSASTEINPAGVSSFSFVNGSTTGTMPVSISTVTTQMVLVPDMGGYSTCSMMTKPASASGCVGGRITLQFAAG